MIDSDNNIEALKRKVEPILRKYNVKQATIVGSVARGDDLPTSDLDIVIQLNETISLLEFAKIKIELEEKLQRKVDLIERSAIKPRLKQSILKNEIRIF